MELGENSVYRSDTCHYCNDTKSYLKENNISFEYFDIDGKLLMNNGDIDEHFID